MTILEALDYMEEISLSERDFVIWRRLDYLGKTWLFEGI